MTDKQPLITMANIESKILLIRGQKVMLDADLAELYEVETRRLNEQVSRNKERFPEDFMFQLTAEEFANLKSQ
ncbi:MAG: ORF6N domain-containing protein, partial [Gallionella sp.]